MSSADAQIAFQQAGPTYHLEAQDKFAHQFDLSRPENAMKTYQELLHQHTKEQFDSVAATNKRRSADSQAAVASIAS
ncbi:hypothetical protein LTR91_007587 [Friedmanniomyces endolithicus]|uniref:Uncharacterized protein n=1 Tax=Friedmanniomyces endolithicus TaxID=329885 RepID=A0AAN6KP68_9PEZI|nr:hypothetical protein LTR94_003155 [Friedmanniomyces endolithicus]KAK0813786.1 hypothetical protein LTR59_000941 [Friedmanniomyces endolithicus]KAK0814780.1 hypothetical protein LTR38_002610 [Friedmanniomyces endolithicus]KAK0815056.1 hypothetical protein LTR75_004057 [Friedmanniomyces endolithicus]KAK0851972.1 hypothetical protein LTR03_003717 [Friedmanniomyces endolithicus]